MPGTPPIDVRVRINFGASRALGPGKIELLEHIASGGSLAWAAAELEMSYRRAWALLEELERAFGEPIAVRTKGGVSGGGAELTPFARRLIAAYRAVEAEASAAALREFAPFARALARAGSARPRRVKKADAGRRPARSRR
jgi:molybdate transport system regulatory protein